MEEEGVKRLVEGSLGRRGRVMGEWERGGVKGEAARVSQELAGGHGEINKPTVGRHSTARQHSWLSYHG